MLALQEATYRYPGAIQPSLHEINLQVPDGQAVGVVGAGESGKSTLCLVASGLAPRSVGGKLSGALMIDGEDTVEQPIHEIVTRVGIVFQNPVTQLSGVAQTVFEEVAFGPLNLGLDRSETVARTVAALDALAIGHLGERDPRRLSGGQMQLVAVAGVLAMRPRHLVLDEPTAQLDPEGKRLVADALRRLLSIGTGLLVAEHDTDLLAELCSTVVVLSAGRLVSAGPPREVLANPRLEEWGVEPPASVRLHRAVSAHGLEPDLIL